MPPYATALVTGASSGLGRAFAGALAARGTNLVLVARDAARLQALADELAARHGVAAEVLAADLTAGGDLARVEARLAADPPVDLLVNNAGYATAAHFHDSPRDAEAGQVLLHCVATTRLTHAALPGMLARGSGAVLNVASLVGLLPGAAGATYTASKAFEIAFSESLHREHRGHGVQVMALAPGFVRTELHLRAGMHPGGPALLWLRPEQVVEEALRDLAAGRVLSVPSRRYRLAAGVLSWLPRGVARWIASRVT